MKEKKLIELIKLGNTVLDLTRKFDILIRWDKKDLVFFTEFPDHDLYCNTAEEVAGLYGLSKEYEDVWFDAWTDSQLPDEGDVDAWIEEKKENEPFFNFIEKLEELLVDDQCKKESEFDKLKNELAELGLELEGSLRDIVGRSFLVGDHAFIVDSSF